MMLNMALSRAPLAPLFRGFRIHSFSCRSLWRKGSVISDLWLRTNKNDYSTAIKNKEKNVMLMGSPGSGKTTVGQILAKRLGCQVIDIDNDFLEKHWGMPVSQKLLEVGPDNFIEEEGTATIGLTVKGHVVSLTGSNPMFSPAMKHLKKTGVCVFLDVEADDIVNRLERMKVDRIVGQGKGVSMADILEYRQQFYEKFYDIRVVCEQGESAESIACRVEEEVHSLDEPTNYCSTRGATSNLNFSEAVLQGLAEDGGLLVPAGNLPSFTAGQWHRLFDLTYIERALRVLEKWIHPYHMGRQALAEMIKEAYSRPKFGMEDQFPIVEVSKTKPQYIQEMFHGPTASFKDGALQLLPSFIQEAQGKSHEGLLLLVATSGDTGSAVLEGFSCPNGENNVKVVVLYPEGGISEIQKLQMVTSKAPNTHIIGVHGDFDWCQSFIKRAFTDQTWNMKLRDEFGTILSAANSVNWGRLIPQIVYHTSAYLDLVKYGHIKFGDEADICIPTGNFGNILAAYYSKMMGIPWRRLICASNTNNVLTDFINSGVYDLRSRHLKVSSSPAIDILKSSNMERFLYHLSEGDTAKICGWYSELETKKFFTVDKQTHNAMREHLEADWCSEIECKHLISKTWQEHGYLLDPHTAVAKAVADRLQEADVPMLISSTAHPAKFAPDVLGALGLSQNFSASEGSSSTEYLLSQMELLQTKPEMHQELRKALKQPVKHNKIINADNKEIIREIENFLRRQA